VRLELPQAILRMREAEAEHHVLDRAGADRRDAVRVALDAHACLRPRDVDRAARLRQRAPGVAAEHRGEQQRQQRQSEQATAQPLHSIDSRRESARLTAGARRRIGSCAPAPRGNN
jgi:hypothetical protein